MPTPLQWEPEIREGRGLPNTALLMSESALAEARQAVDDLNQIAWSLRQTDRERSFNASRTALERAKAIHYRLGQGFALRNLGFCHYVGAAFEQALACLLEGLEVGRESGEGRLIRDCLNFSGAVYASLGDFDTALGYVQQMFDLNVALGDLEGTFHSLVNTGVLLNELGRFDEAITSLQAALETKALQDPRHEAHVISNLGVSYAGLGKLKDALRENQKALLLAEEIGNNDVQAKVLVNIADVQGKLGCFDQALAALERALGIVEQLGAREGVVHCLLTAGHIHFNRGAFETARTTLELAAREAQTLGMKALEFEIEEWLAKTHKALGNLGAALEHFERFHHLERAVRDDGIQRQMRAHAAQRELERTRVEADLERLRNVELAQALKELEDANRDKSELVRKLELQVVQDPLTKLYNRRHLETILTSEFSRARKNSRALPVAMLDIDHFKQVNDRFSHQVGDTVLQEVAELIRQSIRTTDIAARYGGEEFVIVLPRTTHVRALAVCERLRRTIAEHDWARIHPELSVTISLGLASSTDVQNSDKLLGLADDKLYEAKGRGRNRVCV